MTDYTTEPRIWITVTRIVKGQQVQTMREISYEIWHKSKMSSLMLETEVNAMMREVFYG